MLRDLAKRATTRGSLRAFAHSLRGMYEIGKRPTVQTAN
jgi:hypothetical protein